ncbi:MAG: pinensin family lanthipeptide [Cyclobacteriaceae bacterium]
MKTKLSLTDIKVASFITGEEISDVKGGITDPELSYAKPCRQSYIPEQCNTNYTENPEACTYA